MKNKIETLKCELKTISKQLIFYKLLEKMRSYNERNNKKFI